MDEEVLGNKGTLEMAKGLLYLEEPTPASNILQFIQESEQKKPQSLKVAGSSWRPEILYETKGIPILENLQVHDGSNTTGAAVDDGSKGLLESFCNAMITGKRMPMLVEEAYYSCLLALLGNQTMDEHRIVPFPDEYKIR